MNNLPTVTIAVSAFNEEKNIVTFLKSALSQKTKKFNLKKILVISDGSTDETCKKVKSLKSKLIDLKEHNQRKGKSTRLNEIYSSVETDFLVQSDADVIFASDTVVEELIYPLTFNQNIGICGGNPIPLKGKTFIENAINKTCEAYIEIRKLVNNGNNQFSADGRLLALRNETAKQIRVPVNIVSNDKFAYFAAISRKWKYRFVERAIVHYRSPQALREHVKQNTRFLTTNRKMSEYFPEELLRKESKIPFVVLLKTHVIMFIKYPIHCTYIFLINRYCSLKANLYWKQIGAKWDMAQTTKSLVK